MTLKQELRAAVDYARSDPGFMDWAFIKTLSDAASMLEKLLPGEDGEFDEELVVAVDEARWDRPRAILRAIVETLTDKGDSA